MNSRKFLLGGIVAGIAYFLFGFLVYGLLLRDFMDSHSSSGLKAIMRPDDQMILWSMAIGNLLFGFMISYVFTKSGVASVSTGLVMGAVIGLFTSAAIDFITYAQMDSGDMTAIGTDILAMTAISALVGGITGFLFSKMGKTAAA